MTKEFTLINKSPSKNVNKTEFKSSKIEDNAFNKKGSKEHIFETKNKKMSKKNNKFEKTNSKKLIYKKNKSVKNKLSIHTHINKNLPKNNSINNLLSYDNLNERKSLKKDSKNNNINNINLVNKNNENGNNNAIFYSTARTKFYNFNSPKLK